MSAVATHLITAEEFARMPERADGAHDELVCGEIVLVEPINKALHGWVCSNVSRAIANFGNHYKLGWTVLRCGVILGRNPDTVRAPDIQFYSSERLSKIPEGWFKIAPDLAVEVLSPDDRRRSMREKVADYIASGVRLVWLVDPETETVMVYSGSLRGIEYGKSDTLDAGGVIPGFSCPVAEFFS